MKSIKIGTVSLGVDKPLYFIADIAANHDGDINRAFDLIELAKKSGADAAKFQNFTASKIVSKKGFDNIKILSHQANWKKSVYDTYKDASISLDWTVLLKKKCDEVGIDYFSSPYDYESVDAIDPYVNVFKIGSGDITWIDIIKHMTTKNKTIILATGASDIADVERAMDIILKSTCGIVLMQCNTNYTDNPENFKFLNLNVLNTYRLMYPDVVLGLSDHTSGHSSVLASIALGARVIEKHFTDDNNRIGPDHKFAMNPSSWEEMVRSSYEVVYSLGDGVKRIEHNEKDTVYLQRRALRYSKNITKGSILKESDIIALRPMSSKGIPPYLLCNVVGKTLSCDVLKDELVLLEDLQND